MKFKFCGQQDVPAWILSEIAVLSRISSVRLKLITRQVINELTGGSIDIEKVCKLAPKDQQFGPSDIRATLAAIHWILSSATRFNVDHAVLNSELQQLGLPKENSDGVARPFRIHSDRLHAQAAEASLRLPRLVSLDWHTDAVVFDSCAGDLRGGGGSGASRYAPVPVHHLRLGLSHALGQAYPRFPAISSADTPLLAQARLEESQRDAGPAGDSAALFAALGWRPLPLATSPAAPAAVRGSDADAAIARAPTVTAAARVTFSASHSQVVALRDELSAARSALAALTAAMPPPGA